MPYRHSAIDDILEAIGEQHRFRDPVQDEIRRATQAGSAHFEQTNALQQHARELAVLKIDAQRAGFAMPGIYAISLGALRSWCHWVEHAHRQFWSSNCVQRGTVAKPRQYKARQTLITHFSPPIT